MNEQMKSDLDKSATGIQAIKAAARATHLAQYGEEASTFIDGLVDLSFRSGTLMLMLEGAPPAVQFMAVGVLADFCAEIASLRGAGLIEDLTPDLFDKYLKASQAVSDAMIKQMREDAEAAMSRLIVPSHLH